LSPIPLFAILIEVSAKIYFKGKWDCFCVKDAELKKIYFSLLQVVFSPGSGE
jgi:hypothetical protein